MRRTLAVLLGLLVLAGAAVAPAYAAPPAPKVTIEGFIDNTTVLSRNVSVLDIDITRDDDEEWYSRTRARLQVTGEVGATKMVVLLEQDNNFGSQTGGCYGTAPVAGATGSAVTGAGHFGVRDGCLNTEYLGNVETVWMFVEFPLTGKGSLLPFVPVPGIGRVGFQPFDNDSYKLGVVAFGNFGGAHVDIDPFPGFKITGTYAQIDERGTGPQFGFTRGDDFALLFSVEISPVKGIDLKPIYNYTAIENTANPANPFAYGPRTGKGGVADTLAFFPLGTEEHRHTFGIDARLKFGPFSIEPTFLYQIGTREIQPRDQAGNAVGGIREQDLSAWFIDLRAGWQAGPLTLDLLGVYTSGNKADENLRSGVPDVNYYQPVDTNAVYGVDWGAITAITHEYISQLYYGQTGLCPSCSIGYDKYGRIQAGVRAKYAVTPDFVLRALATALWTAEEVDTNSNVGNVVGNPDGQAGGGLYQNVPGSDGNARYLGTEINFGFDWGFAPNIRLLALYAHLFTGEAYNITGSTGTNSLSAGPVRDAKDVDMGSLTLRFTF